MDNLPNLGTLDEQSLKDRLGLGPQWGWDNGITYDPGFAQFKLNKKGLLANGNIDPLNANYQAFLSPNGDSRLQLNGMIDPLKLQYEAMLNQNGNYGMKANIPFLKGLLSLEADKQNEGKRYQLQFQRNS